MGMVDPWVPQKTMPFVLIDFTIVIIGGALAVDLYSNGCYLRLTVGGNLVTT